MFVTVFCAILDLASGQVSWASAGHNPPVLLRTGEPPAFLPTHREPVAGAMPGLAYTTERFTMAPGDSLFLYTDGVTEAMNAEDEIGRAACRERV